jgi:hypothetical protein
MLVRGLPAEDACALVKGVPVRGLCAAEARGAARAAAAAQPCPPARGGRAGGEACRPVKALGRLGSLYCQMGACSSVT